MPKSPASEVVLLNFVPSTDTSTLPNASPLTVFVTLSRTSAAGLVSETNRQKRRNGRERITDFKKQRSEAIVRVHFSPREGGLRLSALGVRLPGQRFELRTGKRSPEKAAAGRKKGASS